MTPSDSIVTAPAERRDLEGRDGRPVIDARNVAVDFKVEGGTVRAVRDVSFQLYRGETVAIVGESGSGKSVTARTIMGLLSKRAKTGPQSRIDYVRAAMAIGARDRRIIFQHIFPNEIGRASCRERVYSNV